MIKSCTGCVPPKRHLGCHSTCPEYIAEKKAWEKKRAEINKQRKIESDFIGDILRNKNRRR